MDRIEEFRTIVKQILNQHIQIPYSHGEIEKITIVDESNDNYILLSVGWDKDRRVHFVVFHLRIEDDKIWVEDDWTEYGVANELVDAGVPKEDIVLGFQPPEKRPYTEFAVA